MISLASRLLAFIYFRLSVFSRPYLRRVHKKFFSSRSEIKIESTKNPEMEQTEIDELKNRGFLNIELNEETSKIFKQVELKINNAINNEKDSPKGSVTKNYLKRIDLDNHPDIIQLGLQLVLSRQILDYAYGYLGEKPLLTEFKVLVSDTNDEPVGSQLFHCDFDDERMLKVFVYINKVTKDHGPLQAIDKDSSERIRAETKYRYGVEGGTGISSHSDKYGQLGEKGYTEFLAEAGDVTLIDAAGCFHRGSRRCQMPRVVLYGSYCTRSSYRFPPFNRVIDTDYLLRIGSPMHIYKNFYPEKSSYLINDVQPNSKQD